MNEIGFSVVITTFNRKYILERAIKSIIQQNYSNYEIIVIDDGSIDGTKQYLVEKFNQHIFYYKMERNSGPGPARNFGIKKATKEWIIILDDDDMILPDSLSLIQNEIKNISDIKRFPVLNFASSESEMKGDFYIVNGKDYFNGYFKGDFLPIIQTKLFKTYELGYPAIRIGGESLLWGEVSLRFGIPTFNSKVLQVFSDAPNRLTSFAGQIQRASEYAQYQDLFIDKFYSFLRLNVPEELSKRWFASIVYWILSGSKGLSINRIKTAIKNKELTKNKIFLSIVLLLLPNYVVRKLFLFYRNKIMKH